MPAMTVALSLADVLAERVSGPARSARAVVRVPRSPSRTTSSASTGSAEPSCLPTPSPGAVPHVPSHLRPAGRRSHRGRLPGAAQAATIEVLDAARRSARVLVHGRGRRGQQRARYRDRRRQHDRLRQQPLRIVGEQHARRLPARRRRRAICAPNASPVGFELGDGNDVIRYMASERMSVPTRASATASSTPAPATTRSSPASAATPTACSTSRRRRHGRQGHVRERPVRPTSRSTGHGPRPRQRRRDR